MPDRREDLAPDVRDLLEGMASDAAPPTKAPPGVLHTARRRLTRNSAALVVALTIVTGGAVAGARLAGGIGHGPALPIGSGTPTAEPTTSQPTPSASESTQASGSPTPSGAGAVGGTGTGPMPAMVFLDGVVYRYSQTPEGLAGEVVGEVPEDTAAQPPVETPFGVLVLGGTPGHGTHLWLIHADSLAPDRLASDLDGFAVSADGSRLAYATLADGSQRSELIERSLQTGAVLHSASVDTYVRVVGYATDVVVLSTGDGASASAAVWSPGASSFNAINGFGRAIAADPASGFAVLTQGDGVCWSIVSLAPTGNAGRAGPPKQPVSCGIAQASFDSDGKLVAGIELTSEARTGPQRLVLAGADSQLGGAVAVDGAFQTQWVGQRIMVLMESAPGRYAVEWCQVSENICPDGPVWTASGAGGDGTAWLVEESPAKG
jgi:hypothetical protein